MSAGPDPIFIHNARVWTDGALVAGADAIAIDCGRIAAIGGAGEMNPPARARRVDARGATATPGLTDAHLHLMAWARSLDELPLHDAGSAADVAARVAARARERGGAIVGRGWDANRWPDAPHRSRLDAAAGGRRVILHSKDFHALWVDSSALRDAGITRATPDPSGGTIERDAAGEPTGVLREHAVRLIPRVEAAVTDSALNAAIEVLHAAGITTVHDFEGREAESRLRGAEGLRVLMQIAHADLEWWLEGDGRARIEAQRPPHGAAHHLDRFRIGALKLFADGTLGSRTAAMLEPYEDGGAGMDLIAPAELERIVRRALEAGIAVAVHAIGDRATRNVLDAFEAAREVLDRPEIPSRIEHLQLVAPDDFARIARLGIAASMQPRHAVSDIAIAERGWGARCERAYAWRTMLDHGIVLAFGSDAPVEAPDPSEGLRSAVTRRRGDGTPAGGWHPAQALSLNEALSCYTSEPARLAGTHPRLGSLRPGAHADLVLWSHDLHGLDPMALGMARPVLTLVGGVAAAEPVPGWRA